MNFIQYKNKLNQRNEEVVQFVYFLCSQLNVYQEIRLRLTFYYETSVAENLKNKYLNILRYNTNLKQHNLKKKLKNHEVQETRLCFLLVTGIHNHQRITESHGSMPTSDVFPARIATFKSTTPHRSSKWIHRARKQ